MSASCRIGILNKDKTITSIYCALGGYPTIIGPTLEKYYADEKSIRNLIALGDCEKVESTLAETISLYGDKLVHWDDVAPATHDWHSFILLERYNYYYDTEYNRWCYYAKVPSAPSMEIIE